MNRILTATALALGIAAAGSASAYGPYGEDQYDWARVVRVDPSLDSYE